ncbi:MAG: STAS/SEC14 domain-containing protein [Solirubrobacterales bacterium]|nr:STAS/SEC14 domain-containing protein [Solirubrobacterales bacterium]
MVELIDGMANGAVGFEAKGEVTAADYEKVIVPAVEAALAEHDKVNLLYVLGSRFEGYELAAMWDDTKVGMGHLFAWERIGLVTDHDAYRRMVQGFGFLIPAHVRVFPTTALEEAKAWVEGG